MAESREEQWPIRPREELRQRLQQEELGRARREETDAARDARAARQRLDSLERQRRVLPPPALPGQPPPPRGPNDRATEAMQDEALRRQQLEYDRARRALDAAEGAAGGAADQSGTGLLGRKPVGANQP